jgi:GH25 family lysozyme M1 (1,4-beta-N-acetylmuramidase)
MQPRSVSAAFFARSTALLLAAVLASCGGPGLDPTAESGLTICPAGATVEGIDVSVYQGTIDWNAVKGSGKTFAIARVSDGLNHFDTQFDRNWTQIKAVALVRGAYQYFEPGQDPVAQANMVLQHVGALGAGDLSPVIDVETMGGQTAAAVVAAVNQWISTVHAGSGRRPIVYSSPSFWNGLGNPTVAADLWIANWGVSCPGVPTAWSNFKLWQYSATGAVPGISGAVDLDRFNGTQADLLAYAGGSGPPPPPPPGALVNGDFEQGTLANWTAAGVAAVESTSVHGGRFAARVGDVNPSGDSSLSQTFTLPAGSKQLSLWFQVVCPDTVAYDWATATLKDETTGAVATVLARSCSNNSTWQQAMLDITASAGHRVTLTLSNHDDGYAGDPTYTLFDDIAVQAASTNPIRNGGFEQGLTGWTTAGSTSSSATAHGGSASAMAGSASPSGDSSLAQTFTVPAAGGTLSFWARVVCPDTVTYDWATATLTDHATGATATLLGKTCSNSGVWQGVSFNLAPSAGHSVTLTLSNHDDGYSGDPTYTLYDDVAVR